MGSGIGRLRKNLDIGLINRLKAGIKHPPKPIKHKKVPRAARTYRAARRNRGRDLMQGVRA